MPLLMNLSPAAASHGQKVAAVAVLLLALLWRVLGGPTQIILLMLGTAASFVAGVSGYLTLRLHFSPR